MPTCTARQAFHHWCQQDPNAEQYMTVAAVIQNVIQCYQVIYEEKERVTTQTSLNRFFKRVDRTESSKKLKPMPSTAGLREIAACPLFPIVNCLVVKNLPAVQETQIQSLGWEDPLEKEMASHSSILAWRFPWTEEPGRLWSRGLQRVGHDWLANTRWSFSSTISHPLPPPVSNSYCLSTWCQPLYASHCTVQGTALEDEKCFVSIWACSFFMYYLYEKCYKPIRVHHYIASCVNWVPKLC